MLIKIPNKSPMGPSSFPIPPERPFVAFTCSFPSSPPMPLIFALIPLNQFTGFIRSRTVAPNAFAEFLILSAPSEMDEPILFPAAFAIPRTLCQKLTSCAGALITPVEITLPKSFEIFSCISEDLDNSSFAFESSIVTPLLASSTSLDFFTSSAYLSTFSAVALPPSTAAFKLSIDVW